MAPDTTAAETMEERALRTLIELGHGVLEELELEPVLQRVLEVARELTGARYAALGVLDAPRTELERFLTVGIDEDARREIGDLPRGHGVLGVLIREPKPLRLTTSAPTPLVRLPDRAIRRCPPSSACRSSFAARLGATST